MNNFITVIALVAMLTACSNDQVNGVIPVESYTEIPSIPITDEYRKVVGLTEDQAGRYAERFRSLYHYLEESGPEKVGYWTDLDLRHNSEKRLELRFPSWEAYGDSRSMSGNDGRKYSVRLDVPRSKSDSLGYIHVTLVYSEDSVRASRFAFTLNRKPSDTTMDIFWERYAPGATTSMIGITDQYVLEDFDQSIHVVDSLIHLYVPKKVEVMDNDH